MRLLLSISLVTMFQLAGLPAAAEGFRTVQERSEFIQLVSGRSLVLPFYGIRLNVDPGGAIRGKGAGRPVRGEWRWEGGLFCRDLFWGERDLGPNCQVVQARPGVLRFVADRGQGRSADFRLR